MKSHNLTRMVTLWHWTMPDWLAAKGGFETKEGVEAFARYAWFVAQNLGSEIDLWLTINEPEVYATMGYQQGTHPPFKKSLILTWRVLENLIAAHRAGYKAIKQALGDVPIGIAKNSAYFAPYRKNNLADQFVCFVLDRISNHYFLQKIQKQLDFIGLNYYFYNLEKFSWKTFRREMNGNFGRGQLTLDDQQNRSDLGWVLFPEGIYHLLKDLKRYHKPIYITENGLADSVDSRRPKFLKETLAWVAKAKALGVDVRGYFYWSLTDNYEWADGFGPRFGLIDIDYVTQKRTVRPSAKIFKEIVL
jgi:beta-glucosidase